MKKVVHAACPHDCPDACGVLITVEDGKATHIQGDPAHPVTRGFLCAKVTKYLDRVYAPDRLLYPMRRVAPKGQGNGDASDFARITWDEAFAEITGRLKQISSDFGPEAILPYSYGGTLGVLNNTGMAHGANIHGANVHLWPFIEEARRKGAKLIVIDPYKTRTARLADWYLPINPGTDVALALGMMHVIINENLHDADYVSKYTLGFEELKERVQDYPPERVAKWTGIAAADLMKLAREYATVRPAVIRVNYGVQRAQNGGMAVRAITMLPCITGSWKEVGGGLQLSTSGSFPLDKQAVERPDLMLRSPLGRAARVVNMSSLGQALTRLDNPSVNAIFVYNSNPAGVAPNHTDVRRGFLRPDLFTVVHDQRSLNTKTCRPRTDIIICKCRSKRSARSENAAPTTTFSANWHSAWALPTTVSGRLTTK